MIKRLIVLLSAICVTMGVVQAPAQNFLKKLKNKAVEAVKSSASDPVKEAINAAENVEGVMGKGKKQTGKKANAKRSSRSGSETLSVAKKTVTIKLCDGVGRHVWNGRVAKVTPLPPENGAKQVTWGEALPFLSDMNNATLTSESEMLDKWVSSGKLSLEPVLVRREAMGHEFGRRISALEKVAEYLTSGDAAEEYQTAVPLENEYFKRAIQSDLTSLYPYLDKEAVKFYKSINRLTHTVTVSVYDGNSADAAIVQIGEMWFKVNKGQKTAKLLYFDMDESVGKDYTVPSSIDYAGSTFSVTEIDNSAFADMKMRSVTLSPGLKKIGEYAFARTRIASINIPPTVTEIGNRAFHNMPALTSVVVPDNVTKMGLGVFSLCTALTEAKLPVRLDKMRNTIFYGCKALTKVVLPQNVTTLPVSTFEGCKALARVDLPQSVATIEQSAFKDSGISSVPVTESLVKIGYSAFEGCNRLTSLSLPSRVDIGMMAFKDCKGLKKVAIGQQYKADVQALYSIFTGCTFVKTGMTTVPSCVSFNP